MNCKDVTKIIIIISPDIGKNIHLAHVQKIAFETRELGLITS
jgi:hypothetical protein